MRADFMEAKQGRNCLSNLSVNSESLWEISNLRALLSIRVNLRAFALNLVINLGNKNESYKST